MAVEKEFHPMAKIKSSILSFYLIFSFSLNYHYQTSTLTNLYLKIAFTDYLLHIYLLVSSE